MLLKVPRSFINDEIYQSINQLYFRQTSVGFVAAAVSMPIGGCRAKRPDNDDVLLVSAETVGVIVAAEPAVL